MYLCARGANSRQFAISKGRNVGVSRKIGGTKECGRAAMDFARTSLLKEEAAAAKPRTGLGGVTRGVVPPLTNTWKQDSRNRTGERKRVNRLKREGVCTAHFLSTEECSSNAGGRHVPGLIPLEHVPLRMQVSSVTRPGDMGTSSAKVNGLFHCSTTPTAGHAWVCTRAHLRTYVRTSVRACVCPTADGGQLAGCPPSVASRRSHGVHPHAFLLRCAAARHLAVRADSLPRDDEVSATPRNARAHARRPEYETRRCEFHMDDAFRQLPLIVHDGTIYRILLSDRIFCT
ncbi:hypothetical protein ALC57_04127 [Trachymyrmex cornetzi]|uniref:Uncharacterized protein n=1 Tax=Trachymyrmex cornetzi TaxID=471704 RepID=A0A195EEH6_9HYME|nr:hypothetical protein ALC57_04127 [Trachymyrmex cornetzi]